MIGFNTKFFFIIFYCGIGLGLGAKPKGVLRPYLNPIGENQKIYRDLLANPDIYVLVGLGPAGCGKTAFACHAAATALSSGLVDRIVITRPTVSVDEELGFLPGSLERKMDPWIRPVMDVLGEFFTGGEIRRLIDDGVVEIAPLAYMRGRTFRRSFLIADEMQNSSPNQMLMMLTRIGQDSKLVITGDLLQSDRPGKNGLADFYERLQVRGDSLNNIRLIKFDVADVQRSPVVASILRIYENPVRLRGNDDAAIIPKFLDSL
jgi:phosphate starvation-inducible PhoH-like protein